MITLYTFGPLFGLPDPSPFVLKTWTHLQMAGLDFVTEPGGPQRGPKGKLPFIDDDGAVVADSVLIRAHLERAHGADFDNGLDGRQQALAWAAERMLEDHLYWAMVLARWADDENFAKGPAHFFDGVPEAAREGVRAGGRQQVLANTQAHGLGRHSPEEIDALAARSVDSLAELMGDGAYLMGDQPCGADASAFAFIAAAAAPYFETPLRRRIEGHSNLMRYRDRMMQRHFPAYA
jgi:glutathione S-transferase